MIFTTNIFKKLKLNLKILIKLINMFHNYFVLKFYICSSIEMEYLKS